MTDRELIELVRRARLARLRHDAEKTTARLSFAKELESKVDEELDRRYSLFGAGEIAGACGPDSDGGEID